MTNEKDRTTIETQLRNAIFNAERLRMAATTSRHDAAAAFRHVASVNAPPHVQAVFKAAHDSAVVWEDECLNAERAAVSAFLVAGFD